MRGNYRPVDEVSQVVEKLGVVLEHKIVPEELSVGGFRPHEQQVETPDVRVCGGRNELNKVHPVVRKKNTTMKSSFKQHWICFGISTLRLN